MKQAIECITKNYFNFSGRASRKEYWQFYFMVLVFSLVLARLNLVYISLLLCIPTIAVCWRRLHDINKSGKYYFLGLIPVIGTIWLIILLCKKGNPEPNTYGESSSPTLARVNS